MPHARTKEEGVPLTTRLSRMMKGRGKDVQLPLEGRQRRDPRLPPDPATTGRSIREGFGAVRRLTKPAASRSKRSAIGR